MEKVRGQGHTVSDSATRPANTTTYTAGDVVGDGTVLEFVNASARSSEPGIIQQAIISSSAYVTPAPDLELWLFDTTVTADADNAAFTPTDAELATLVGVIDFSTTTWKTGTATAGAGGNMVCVADNLGIPFNTISNQNSLYGVLVTRNAYVPISGEIFTIRLQIID